MAGEPSRNQPPNQNTEGGRGGFQGILIHFDDQLPGDVELPNFGENVDNEVVRNNVVGMMGVVLGPEEKGEGNFGGVSEAQKGLVNEVRGEGNAVELERGLHGVERVVVLEQDSGDQIGVVGRLDVRKTCGKGII